MALTCPFAYPWHHLVQEVVHSWSRSPRQFIPQQAAGMDLLSKGDFIVDSG